MTEIGGGYIAGGRLGLDTDRKALTRPASYDRPPAPSFRLSQIEIPHKIRSLPSRTIVLGPSQTGAVHCRRFNGRAWFGLVVARKKPNRSGEPVPVQSTHSSGR